MKRSKISYVLLVAVIVLNSLLGSFLTVTVATAEEGSDDIITLNTVWRYLDDGTDPAGSGSRTSWTELDFNDSSWKTNAGKQAKFGAQTGKIGTFSNGITPTVLLTQYFSDGNNIPAYFFRTTVEIKSLPKDGKPLVGLVTYDDAAIVYINGKKVYSFAEPTSGFNSNLAYGANPAPGAPEKAVMVIDPSVLRVGKNVIAVELHQANKTSSDIYFEMSSLGFGGGGQEYVTMNVGSNETERNFAWYFPLAKGSVQYAVRNGNTFPKNYETVSAESVSHNGTYIHRATVKGLKPDTEYVYRVVNDQIASENYYFKTDGKDSFNFLFVTDPQIGASGSMDNDAVNWNKTLEVAEEMFPDTALIVSAGDQINWDISEDQYRRFFLPKNLTSLALAPSIGNHDATSSNFSEHFNTPNNTLNGYVYGATEAGGDYWYTYNNALFIHLNTNNASTAEHKAFIEAAFKANPNVTWRILVTHQSMFSGGGNHIKDPIVTLRNLLVPVIAKFDFDVVLSGHDHVYSRSYMMVDGFTPDAKSGSVKSVTDHKGILYLVGGTASGSKHYGLLSDADSPHVAFKTCNVVTFTNIEVTKSSFRLTTYRTSDKAVIDSFEIIKDKELTADVPTPEPEPEPEPDPEEKRDNLLLGKDYVTSSLYETDGVVSYPDESSSSFTDGVIAGEESNYKDVAFAGFNKQTADYRENGYAYIAVDLEKQCELDKFVAYYATQKVSGGIKAPALVTVYVSDDNESWLEVGSVIPNDSAVTSCNSATLVLDQSVSCRYVQYRFTGNSNWIFICEVEAYGGADVDIPIDSTVLGDVNNNGKIEAEDCALIKRAIFGKVTLDEVQMRLADVNKNENVEKYDYILVKRHALGISEITQ